MKRPVLLACAALAGSFALVATASAQNTTKSSSTNSCPSQQSVMTSNWSGATSTSAGSFLCAQEYHAGDVNVDSWGTSTFNIDTNVMYFPTYHCWSTTDDKDFSITDIEIFGAGSVSATNWDTTNHHWGAGWLFTLGAGPVSGFTNGCKSTTDQVWEVPPSLMQISSISASGLPDNGASKAGVPYTITVSGSPTGDVSGYQAVLQDNGQNVAVGTFDSTGTATFKWTPAEMGNRKIQVAWPGNSGAMGNITDAYTVNVAGGMAVKFDSAPALNAAGDVVAKVDLDTSPDTFPSGARLILLDATSQKPVAQPVAITPPSSGYTTSETLGFVPTPGYRYKLVAMVEDTAGNVIGQSYMAPFSIPSVINATVPGSVFVGSNSSSTACPTVAIPVSITPSTATGTVTFTAPTATGATSTTATLASGAATVQWCPPASVGTYNYTLSYPGNAATAAANDVSGTVTVTSPAPTVTIGAMTVNTKAAWGGNGTATATVKLTGATTGTVALGADGTKLGSATASGSSVNVTFTYVGGTTYALVARLNQNGQLFASATKVWTGPSSGVAPAPTPMSRVFGTPAARGEMGLGARQQAPRRPGGRPGRTTPADGAGPANTGALTLNRWRRVTKSGRSVTIACPAGYSPLQGGGFTSGPATRFSVSFSGRKATITSPSANVGQRMQGQLMCRDNAAPATVLGGMAYGTRRGDHLVITQQHGVAFGGPGRDRIQATGAGSVAWGGFGSDRIVVAGADSVADGGPGRDRLLAVGRTRMLLIGGQGRDVLVGGLGATYINAADGNGGDHIICRSSANRVRMDAGDTMTGPCRMGDAGGTMEPTKPMSR